MSVKVKRPRTTGEIRALIRERDRHIAALEKALAVRGLPRTTRQHLQHNLRGERMNRQSWIDFLEKRNAA
jgi:hypothetical protein